MIWRLLLLYPPLRKRLLSRLETADAEMRTLVNEMIRANPALSKEAQFACIRRREAVSEKIWDVLDSF